MTEPRIIVRYFGSKHWHDHARVLAASARQHCPRWTLDVQAADPAPLASPRGLQLAVSNTQKLDLWAEAVDAAAEGDRLLLIDADTAILRPLDEVWARPFDVAYTTKHPGARFPFNGGVIFLRVSAGTKDFMRQWQASNRLMFDNPKEHDVWKPQHGGMNQSALGMLLSANVQAKPAPWKTWRHGLDIVRLPCVEWNCEDESWEAFDPHRTRIVHFKGELQRAILRQVSGGPAVRPLVALWRQLLAEVSAPVPVQAPEPPSLPREDQAVRPADLEYGDPMPAVPPTPQRLTRRQRRQAAQTVRAEGV